MDRKIIWEKWVDPMGVDADKDEFVNEKDLTEFEKSEHEDKEGVIYRARPAALTNFGFIPINSHNDPAKAFDFWVGHTNFYIGSITKEIIDNTPGVEIFDVFSGYRFRISVGKAFKFSDVRVAIESRLLALNINPKNELSIGIDPEVREKIMAKVDEVKKLGDYWIMYVLPNSEIEVSIPKDFDTFNNRKKILLDTRELAGGIVLSSEDFGV